MKRFFTLGLVLAAFTWVACGGDDVCKEACERLAGCLNTGTNCDGTECSTDAQERNSECVVEAANCEAAITCGA